MRNLLYIVTLLLLAGCSYASGPVVSGLDDAERLMQTDPAAALERLNAYDVAEFPDSASMARWALLYSEAMVANRLTAPTDTIINIAIDYYGAHRLDEQFRHASRLKALLTSQGSDNALASALYLQKEKEFMLYRERTKREQYLFVGLAVLLIALGVIVWQRQRLKVREAQRQAMVAEAAALCESLQARLRQTLSGRFDIIDGLCETWFESQGTKSERKAIADKVKANIAELQADGALFAEMERSVNDCRDGLLTRLRAEWPAIKPEEYRLMVYLASGLSNRSIAALLGESVDVVYKRKSRLKARIFALDCPQSALFRSVF